MTSSSLVKSKFSEADTNASFEALIGRLEQDHSIREAIESAYGDSTITDSVDDDSGLLIVLHVALDALHESNDCFSAMLANTELASLMLDSASRIVYCNDYLLQLMSWKREEVIGKNWFDMLFPLELNINNIFQPLFGSAGETRHQINEIPTRSGERRFIQWNNSLLRSDAGKVIGTVSIGTDITECTRREKDLHRFRLVMDVTADAIYMLDRTSMCLVDVNDAACRMLGYSREEILTLPPEMIFSFTRDELAGNWDELMERGDTGDIIETLHQRKDKSWIPIEIQRRAVRSDNTWIVVGIAREISVHKKSETEQDFQAHLRNTVDAALIASDMSGNINYWSTQAEQLYGWTSAEAIGQNVVGTIFIDRLRVFSTAFLEEIKQGHSWRCEHQARRKDGICIPVQLSFTPIRNPKGELTGMICTSRDKRERSTAEKALRISKERFEIVARATNDIVWDWDLRDDTMWWNENITSSLGYDRAKLERGVESWFKSIHPEDYERVIKGIYDAIDSDVATWQDEYRFRHCDGSYVTVFDRSFILRDKATKAIRMIGAMMDISARKKAELLNSLHAMQQSLLAEFGQKALARTNLEAIMDEAVVVASNGLGVKFCRALQLSSDATSLIFKAGCGWNEQWLEQHIPIINVDVRKGYELHLSSKEPIIVDDFQSETRFIPSEILKEHHIVSAVEVLIQGPSGIYGVLGAYSCDPHTFSPEKVSFLRSIAATLGTAVERAHADEKIAYLTQFDALTGLPNRNLFHDLMMQALSQAERTKWQVGILYIDLDRFKIVNDTYGHAVGDTLLMLVAQRLGNCVRSEDTVGRLGGDEFAIVLSHLATPYDANLVAQKILDELAHPFKLDAYETYATASIGISLYPSDGNDCDVLLKNADAAMYRAKKQGGNNFEFYTQTLKTRISHRINLERELRHALERQELELYYQPQISLDTGRIVAAEALIRWRHPLRGVLEPDAFIGIAEESGLIVPIGQWVVDTACKQVMEWHRCGHSELTVAVNISPTEIRRGGVPEQIRTALERAGLGAQNFEVEITENMAMNSAESFIDTLRLLKKVGVMIAIDDFGTGYSNLNDLKRFPVDTVKIDQTFIRDIVTDTDDAVIVRAIIAMAHQLKLEVVAQGVETEAQASFLRRNHVDLVQGILFAPALDTAAFGRLLNTHLSQPLPTKPFALTRSLLIVDDEENILRALKRTLRRDGYEIHTCNSAHAGLEILARTPIGVIISDERMPEMSGSEFLVRVKALYPDTVRIMLSGYTDLKIVTAAINEGAIYKFLTKPWEDDALREDIRQAFRRQEEKSQENVAQS